MNRYALKLTAILLAGLIASGAAMADNVSEKVDGTVITMVRIKPGSFEMGSNNEKRESPVHKVSIDYAFEIGKTEVTQGQWKAMMGDNPSNFNQCGDSCPVDSVSYEDVLRFIKQLNSVTGKKYRLPTEAEWEYACRAGGNDTYCGGNDLDQLGWYDQNSGGTNPVAMKKANAWGLYDMSGNVWEWVQDAYHQSYNGAPTDGSAWNSSPYMSQACHPCRMLRGGSWLSGAQGSRAALRYYFDPAERFVYDGFRLARTLP